MASYETTRTIVQFGENVVVVNGGGGRFKKQCAEVSTGAR